MLEEQLHSSLRVEGLSLWVNLGCTPEERASPQEVLINFELRFSKPLTGVRTDQLEDVICYGEIAARLRHLFAGREYALIEKMAGDAYLLLREFYASTKIYVEVHKLHPPVPDLRGGAKFRLGDFQP